MKETKAQTNIECIVQCPYCDYGQDRLDDLKDHFNAYEFRAESCEAEIKCESCKEVFIVTEIFY